MIDAPALSVDRGFEINNGLDPSLIREVLSARRRVHITSILRESDAWALHQELRRYPEWCLSVKEGGWDREIGHDGASRLSAMQELEIRDLAYASANTGHAHLYKRAHFSSRHTALVQKFHRFTNSEPFLAFARQAIGLSSISRVEMRIICLCAGHFISSHNDAVELAAGCHRTGYLFQLTPSWSPDWGGQLEFLDRDGGDVQEAYVPRFNSLILFSIPQWHAVSMVVPFATDSRYTLSGFIEGS